MSAGHDGTGGTEPQATDPQATDPQPARTVQQPASAAERIRALPFLLTGIALVIHILTPLPYGLSFLLGAVGIAGILAVVACGGADIGGWPSRELIVAGVVAAGAAVVAYDASRLALSVLAGWEVGPFEAFPHFGTALLGESAPLPVRQVAGVAFHLTNAVGFGIAYVIVFRDRGLTMGVLWGLGLEVAMLAVYPYWLQLRQLAEFTTMSMLGHVAYGAALGLVAQRRLRAVAR